MCENGVKLWLFCAGVFLNGGNLNNLWIQVILMIKRRRILAVLIVIETPGHFWTKINENSSKFRSTVEQSPRTPAESNVRSLWSGSSISCEHYNSLRMKRKYPQSVCFVLCICICNRKWTKFAFGYSTRPLIFRNVCHVLSREILVQFSVRRLF